MDNAAVIEWLQAQAEKVEFLLSVCTGSLVLARAGLLDIVSSDYVPAALLSAALMLDFREAADVGKGTGEEEERNPRSD